MKKNLRYTILPLVLLVLALAWIIHFHHNWAAAATPKWHWVQATLSALAENTEAPAADDDDDPDTSKNETPVHIAHVTTATLRRYVDAFGTVIPRPQRAGQMAGGANIASPVTGVVAKVLCQVGQQVHANDPLIQLDDRQLQAAEDQAAAVLAQARASQAIVKGTPSANQLQISLLAVEKTRAAADLAGRAYERTKALAADQGASAKSVDQAAADKAAAENDAAVAERQLAILKASPTPEDLASEQAKVDQAAAALAAAKVQHQMMTIAAPIDGTVAAVTINPGESVDPTKPLVQIVALDRLMVDLDIPAADMPPDAEKLSALVIVPAAAGAPPNSITAKVTFVSPQVDPRNGTVLVGIDLPADAAIRPGLSVLVRVIAAEHKDVLAVPRESVVADENGDPVIALVEGDRATHKTVKTGIEENGMIEVEAFGLKDGDTIVTAGIYGLPQASRIKVIN